MTGLFRYVRVPCQQIFSLFTSPGLGSVFNDARRELNIPQDFFEDFVSLPGMFLSNSLSIDSSSNMVLKPYLGFRGDYAVKRRMHATLGTRGFSCAVPGFVQVLKSDQREKPLDQSAIPLIVASQLQPRLYQNIQNQDVLLIGSSEISNVSNALIGLQSQ